MGSFLSAETPQQRGAFPFPGCCAASSIHGGDIDNSNRAGPEALNICCDQPQPIVAPQTLPRQATTSTSTMPKWRGIRMLSFGRPGTSHSLKSTIGAPQDFRRVETTFHPGIGLVTSDAYVSPSYDQAIPIPENANRPSGLTSTPSSLRGESHEPPPLARVEFAIEDVAPSDAQPTNTEPTIDYEDLASSLAGLHHHDQGPVDFPDFAVLRSSNSTPNLQSNNRSHPEQFRAARPMHSFLCARDPPPNSETIDDEIRELDALVEEKRGFDPRSQLCIQRTASSRRVLAVAATAKMPVRAESPWDIRSALRRPALIAKPDRRGRVWDEEQQQECAFTAATPPRFTEERSQPSTPNRPAPQSPQATKLLIRSRSFPPEPSSQHHTYTLHHAPPTTTTAAAGPNSPVSPVSPVSNHHAHHNHAGTSISSLISTISALSEASTPSTTSLVLTAATTPPLTRSPSLATTIQSCRRCSPNQAHDADGGDQCPWQDAAVPPLLAHGAEKTALLGCFGAHEGCARGCDGTWWWSDAGAVGVAF